VQTVTALLDEPPAYSRQTRGGVFLVIKGPDRGLSVRLGDQPISFGSGTDCTLVLDNTVSRRHLEAQLVDDEVIVSDTGSTNGCLMHGVRIDRAAIGFGTELKIGRTILKFVPDEEFVEPAPSARQAFGSIVGADTRMRQMFTLLEDAAPTNATILIEGETGTGKELIAEEIHTHSNRADGPFNVFDCSSVPRELVASILFGHLKGSYTGAVSDRRGVFADSHGGTLFLDEIGELPLDLQPALLRALDKRAVCRVGSSTYETFDVRVVAATNRDLRAEVAKKRFREDLYYRLAVIRCSTPALRERGTDIPLLIHHFMRTYGANIVITPEDMTKLIRHTWPGNVRELRNVIERACLLAREGVLCLDGAFEDTMAPTGAMVRTDLPFKEAKNQLVEAFEREYIADLVGRHASNLSAAAREAQMDRKHLRELMRKYGLELRASTNDE
jgi:two-component system, NtrC family, nitrogen regulation response regulator GlnG